MNNPYAIVLLAFLLGQFLITSIVVYDYQKSSKINYFTALTTYLKAEVGFFIIGIIAILCVCFILSDFIDLNVTKDDLINLEHKSLKETMQIYFRTSAFILGSFIQYIAFKYRAKGKDAIDKIIDQNNN